MSRRFCQPDTTGTVRRNGTMAAVASASVVGEFGQDVGVGRGGEVRIGVA